MLSHGLTHFERGPVLIINLIDYAERCGERYANLAIHPLATTPAKGAIFPAENSFYNLRNFCGE